MGLLGDAEAAPTSELHYFFVNQVVVPLALPVGNNMVVHWSPSTSALL